MTILFQDNNTEDVIFRVEESKIVPNVGESVMIDDVWYEVVERTFYYKRLNSISSNSCTIWIKQCE